MTRRMFHGSNTPGLKRIRPSSITDRAYGVESPSEALLHSLRKVATFNGRQHVRFSGRDTDRTIRVDPSQRRAISKAAFVYQIDPAPFRRKKPKHDWTSRKSPKVLRILHVPNLRRALERRGWRFVFRPTSIPVQG